MKDYYKILGVSRTANYQEIKKAYREKSKIYHPDVCSNKEYKNKFLEIQEAYEILRDPKKRNKYDIQLMQFEQNNVCSSKLKLDFDLFLSFEEAYYGGKFLAKMPIKIPCPNCTSHLDLFCSLCKGSRFLEKVYHFSLYIPPKIKNGAIITLPIKDKDLENIYIKIRVLISCDLTSPF